MNIRPLALRDGIPAVSFSHEYDEDDKRYVNVAYVVVDYNGRLISKAGESYEACEALIDTIIDEEEYCRNYDPSCDVIDTLDVIERIDGGEDHICLMADGSVRLKTVSYDEVNRKIDDSYDDIPF